MGFIKQNHRLFFYSSWLILNLVQAWSTGLLDDEAYYWIYSQFPAWGYFDHPPMIAMLIKAGTTIFSGELGVRFFIVILNVLTILIIENLLNKKDHLLFYAICGSIAVAQIGGIIAVPDLPLLFFVSLYFLLYRRFSENMNLLNTMLLGVGISLMLYSKYHGVLIVLFTLISNLKLLTRYQTYLAAAIAFILFLPHVYWQFEHELPSVQYHLFERNASHYRSAFTTEYILGQIALAGPLIGWLFIYASIKYKPLSATEKALKWSLFGIYIFFLLSTIKGRVEANWTIPGFVALIVLSHQYISTKPVLRKWVYRTVPFTLLLVFVARIYMGLDLPRSKSFSKDEFHGNRELIAAIESRANNENVVVINSYQTPSKYWFYSGKPALGLNTAEYRRNNYNFWPIERQFFGKPALVMGRYDSVYLNDRYTNYHLRESGSMHVPFYYSLSAIQIKDIKAAWSGKNLSMQFLADIPTDYRNLINNHPIDTAQLYVAVIFDNKPVEYIATGYRVAEFNADKVINDINFPMQLPPGYAGLKLSISSVIPGRLSVNSTNFKVR